MRALPTPASLLLALLLATPATAQTLRREPAAAGRQEQKALCVQAIQDRSTGACLPASSVPTPGHLLPLGAHFMVDPTGMVGIGTTLPARALDVVGKIRSRSGGIEFPDGTLQTTATLQGPIGPQGPPGPLDPPTPTTVLGTIELVGICGPAPIYEVAHRVDPFLPGRGFNLSVVREVDGCSQQIHAAFLAQQQIAQVIVELGDLRITADSVRIDTWELGTPPGLVPREELVFDALQLTWDWFGQGGPTQASWHFGLNTGSASPSLDGAEVVFVRPDVGGSAMPGEVEIRSAAQSLGSSGSGFRIEKELDALTPSALHAAIANARLGDSDVLLMQGAPGKQTPLVKTNMASASVLSVELALTRSGKLVSTVDLAPALWSVTFF